LAVDGSIVQAQFCADVNAVIRDLRRLVTAVAGEDVKRTRAA
jgi:hypothetical protein